MIEQIKEIWKPLIYNGVDYTGLYEVSNFGNIVTYIYGKRQLLCKSRTYRRSVVLRKGDLSESSNVARLIATMFIRPLKASEIADHKDNDPTNDHADNLQVITQSENVSKDHWTKQKKYDEFRHIQEIEPNSKSKCRWSVSVTYRKELGTKYIPVSSGRYEKLSDAQKIRDMISELREKMQGASIRDFKIASRKMTNEFRVSIGLPKIAIRTDYKGRQKYINEY